MTTITTDRTTITLPKAALAALTGAGVRCGGLSPLARIAPGQPPPDAAALQQALTALPANATGCMPALLDPRLAVLFLAGDGTSALAGQYLWNDPAGASPGFQLAVQPEDLTMAGPVDLTEVALSVQDRLALGSVAEPDPVAFSLTAGEFWVLVALLDAYRDARLRRQLARIGGTPVGVAAGDVRAMWLAGRSVMHLGWGVSLFSALLPDAVPADFEGHLDGFLTALEEAELVMRLRGEANDPLGDVVLLGDSLQALAEGVSQAVVFGVAVQRVRQPGQAEVLTLGGWRTPGGIWLADFCAMDTGRVTLSLVGPSFFTGLLDVALNPPATEPGAPVSPDARYTAAGLLALLDGTPVAAPAATSTARFCTQCGQPLSGAARFCVACGAPAQL